MNQKWNRIRDVINQRFQRSRNIRNYFNNLESLDREDKLPLDPTLTTKFLEAAHNDDPELCATLQKQIEKQWYIEVYRRKQ